MSKILSKKMIKRVAAWKVSKNGIFSGPYFPVFGLNTEIYGVNLYIQSKYGKMQTRKNSVFGHFSHSGGLIADSKFMQFNILTKCISWSRSRIEREWKGGGSLEICLDFIIVTFFRKKNDYCLSHTTVTQTEAE